MAANKKPRKQYRQRYTGSKIPIVFGLNEDMRTDLGLPPHIILDAFKRGAGDEEGAHTLAAAVNVAAVLARSCGPDENAIANAGLAAVANVLERGKSGKWGVSGDEAKAIGAAIVMMEDLQRSMTRRTVRDAIEVVFREAAM